MSALDGRSTDNSFYRRKGQAMIEQARSKREDAILVRQLVDKRKKELKHRAATSALTPFIEWKNPTGASIRARIITFASGQAIIERQDGELFQIPLSNVAAAYHPLFDVVRLKEFGLKARGVCELSEPGEHGLRGEIIYWNEALLWVRTPAGDVERIANNERRDVRRELLQELERAKQEESALDVLAGKRVKFTVRRALSPQHFPDAAIWGEHLYEVAVANDYALVVTNHTSFVTRGTGELRLRHARNLDTYLDNGSLRTVPVLVEVEQPSVWAYEEAVKTRARIEAQLRAVEENQEVYATIFSN